MTHATADAVPLAPQPIEPPNEDERITDVPLDSAGKQCFAYGVTGATGLGGNDFISGEQYDDFLDGGAGDDLVWGGAGSDTLNRPGARHFHYKKHSIQRLLHKRMRVISFLKKPQQQGSRHDI